MTELTEKQQKELKQEADHHREIVTQTVNKMEAHDRSNRHRIKSLEEQVVVHSNKMKK